MGIKTTTLSKWEKGDTIPNTESFIRICNYLKANPMELFEFKENKKTVIENKKILYSYIFLGVIILSLIFIIFFMYNNTDKTKNYEIISGNENYVIRGNIYIGENNSIINLHEFNIIDDLQYEKVYFLDYGIYSDSKVIEHTDNCKTYKIHQNDELYDLGKYAKNKVRTFVKTRKDFEEGITNVNKHHFYLIVNYLTENREIKQLKIPLKLKEI